MTFNVGIYVFNEVEVLDFAGPFQVFSTATRVMSSLSPSKEELFAVFMIGIDDNPIRTRGGLSINPDCSIDDHPDIDLLVIPGGDVTAELRKSKVVSWIAGQTHNTKLIASICTGAFLLGQAGLLHGLKVTTHWQDIEELSRILPSTKVIENVRYIDQGNIITSAGISAGIDMSLHLVSRLTGEEVAVKTARQMEFAWSPGH
jgi:transcriptional regulator GlxA family with amidase domain